MPFEAYIGYLHDQNQATRPEIAASLEALVCDAVTRTELAARMDDGAFAFVVRAERIEDAMRVAETMRVSFAKTGARASFGVAAHAPGETLADLLERADAALYLAKGAGGDAVFCDTDAQVAGLREALNLLGRRRYAAPPRKVA